jgi:hypothetical protein
MANPGEEEVFRIMPTIGKCYKWAESTRRTGVWPNEKRFAPKVNVIYVGELVNIAQGGWGDGSWRTDTFRKYDGTETVVPHSYEGNTCFIEVGCEEKHKVGDVAMTAMAPGNLKKNPNQKSVLGDPNIRGEIKKFLLGGKNKKRSKKSRKSKGSRKSKRTKSHKRN